MPQTPTTDTASAPTLAETMTTLYPTSAVADAEQAPPAEGLPGGDPPAVDGAGASPVTPTEEAPVAPKEGDTVLAKTEGEDTPAPEPAPVVDPASYTDFTLPEGFTADDALLTDFRKEAAALSLPQAAAQTLVDLYTRSQQAAAAKITEDHTALQAQWLSESNALPELSGPTKGTTQVAIGRVMDEYGTPALREFLRTTGLGNHPELVRLVAKVGAALTEGSPSSPGRAVQQTTQRKGVSALYPTDN